MTPNRRQFLIATTGAVAGASWVHAQDDPDRGWIDAHVHVWTPESERYPTAEGWDRKGRRASFTPEELFAECRPHGVSRIVLIQMSFYQFDNSYMLDVMRRHEGVFSGVAIVDETAPDLAAKMRDLNGQGVRGFRLYANAKNAATWERSAEMHSMWQEAEKNRQSICCLTDPDALPFIHRMCQRHPQTPVVIDHFARLGMRGPVDRQPLDRLLKLSEFDHVTVKTSAFYALGAKTPPYNDLAPLIRQLRDAFGAERLMWASDCPFQVEGKHTYEASITLIRDRLDFLSDAEKNALLRGTAERVFFEPGA